MANRSQEGATVRRQVRLARVPRLARVEAVAAAAAGHVAEATSRDGD